MEVNSFPEQEQYQPLSLPTCIPPHLLNIDGAYSGLAPDQLPPQVGHVGTYQDCLNEQVPQGRENFVPHVSIEPTDGQNSSGQILLGDFSSVSPGFNDFWNTPQPQLGFSPLPDSSDGAVIFASQAGNQLFSSIDEPPSSLPTSYIHGPAAITPSVLNNNFDADIAISNQHVWPNETMQEDPPWSAQADSFSILTAPFQPGILPFDILQREGSMIEGRNMGLLPSMGLLTDEYYPNNGPQDQGNLNALNEVFDIPTDALHQVPPSQPAINNKPSNAFGPSRPISLPPARRGGRKGPLSAEALKRRRESRKQGVCIRCRKMKKEVSSTLS